MNWLSKLLRSNGPHPPTSWTEWMAEAGSRSGYVREAAVQALALSGHGEALPVLLARANDWVPEVRRAAYAALEAFLHEEHVGAWGRALGDVAALRRAARADHTQLLQRIDHFLAVPAHLSALKRQRAELPRASVRLLLPLELRAAGDEEARYGVLKDAVLSTDIAVASDAASMIETIEAPAHRRGLFGAACLSSYAAVRVAGLRIALQSPSPSVQSLARALAFDPSASVRAIAQRALVDEREALIDEALGRLRAARSSRARAITLDTICALGAPDAMALCEAAAADPAAAVRCVAYARRLAAAAASERDGLVAQGLRDRSPRVRRLAVAQVKRGATAPSGAALLAIHRASPHAMPSLVSVAAHLSPWARLEFLFGLVKDSADDPAWAERLGGDLDRWKNDMFRCFVGPAPGQVDAVAGLWADVRSRLPQPLRDGLADHLRAFGILDAP